MNWVKCDSLAGDTRFLVILNRGFRTRFHLRLTVKCLWLGKAKMPMEWRLQNVTFPNIVEVKKTNLLLSVWSFHLNSLLNLFFKSIFPTLQSSLQISFYGWNLELDSGKLWEASAKVLMLHAPEVCVALKAIQALTLEQNIGESHDS